MPSRKKTELDADLVDEMANLTSARDVMIYRGGEIVDAFELRAILREHTRLVLARLGVRKTFASMVARGWRRCEYGRLSHLWNVETSAVACYPKPDKNEARAEKCPAHRPKG